MANIFQIQTYELKGCQFFNSEFCRTQEEGRHTRRKINASVIFSSFFCTHSLLLLQSLIESFSSHLIEFCAVFAISCKVACIFHFTLCEHEPESVGSCPRCWNLSFDKLNWTLSTLFYCFCFPPLNSWSDCFYFVTKSSGMTCNTPKLAFNPQCKQ